MEISKDKIVLNESEQTDLDGTWQVKTKYKISGNGIKIKLSETKSLVAPSQDWKNKNQSTQMLVEQQIRKEKQKKYNELKDIDSNIANILFDVIEQNNLKVSDEIKSLIDKRKQLKQEL